MTERIKGAAGRLHQIEDVPAYRRALQQGRPVEMSKTAGLRGRILRGKEASAEDFTRLGLAGRELVFIMGPDGLAELSKGPLAAALGRIGLMRSYVAGRIAQGHSFKLVVFEGGSQAPLATWDNALDLIAIRHPAVAADIALQRQNLKHLPMRQLVERMLPDDLDQIELAGPRHPRFMTTERYLEIPVEQRQTDPLYLRRWLLHTEHLGTLFRGDGYTQTPNGERGIREYLMPNGLIADLPEAAVIDLPLDLDAGAEIRPDRAAIGG